MPGEALTGEDGLAVSRHGAIAQLGERVLCKHEVVGSIPSGSTRWNCRSMPAFKVLLLRRPRNIASHAIILTRMA